MKIFIPIILTATASAGCLASELEWPVFAMKANACKVESNEGGKGERTSFTEVGLKCGDLSVKLEITQPVTQPMIERQVTNELIMVQDNYSAMRNPYAGFISDTAQCPAQRNFFREEFAFKGGSRPLLFGRLTSRGSWGACGRSNEDFWGAITFASDQDAMMKVQITGKKKLTRAKFTSQVRSLLQSIRAR